MKEEKGIFAENNGGDFEQLTPGSYVARCYKMVDIGTQRLSDYTTGELKPVHQVIVFWEVLEDENNDLIRMKDDRPFSIQKTYKLSMHPKANLRKDLDGWRGIAFTEEESKLFNVTKLLDKYCRLNLKLSQNGKYINVDSVGSTKRKPAGHNDVMWWSALDTDRNMDIFNNFPDWLKKKIEFCEEWNPVDPHQGEIEGIASKRKKTVTANGTDDEETEEEIDLSEIPF